jgi:hypothetical protein
LVPEFFCSLAGLGRRKLRAMKTKICFSVALALVHICPGQTPRPTASASGWQLSPPFEMSVSPTPATPAPTATPGPTAPATIVQTAPPPSPALSPAQTARAGNSAAPVWVLTFIKTKSGLTDEYLKSITGSLKPIFEEEKRQQIILDYKVLSGDAIGDFNIIIMVEYPNAAALDGLREKTEPIIDKIIGPADKRRDIAAKRLDIREILATKTMREITLK